MTHVTHVTWDQHPHGFDRTVGEVLMVSIKANPSTATRSLRVTYWQFVSYIGTREDCIKQILVSWQMSTVIKNQLQFLLWLCTVNGGTQWQQNFGTALNQHTLETIGLGAIYCF